MRQPVQSDPESNLNPGLTALASVPGILLRKVLPRLTAHGLLLAPECIPLLKGLPPLASLCPGYKVGEEGGKD